MKFNTISKAALMAVLLSTTAPVFGASAVDEDPVDVAAAEHRLVVAEVPGFKFNIDVIPGDQKASFEELNDVSTRLRDLSNYNVASDLENLAAKFDNTSIQSHMLHCIMAVVEMLNPEMDGAADIYSGVANDIKAASGFFRFSMADISLPSDSAYINTVKSLLQWDQPLTS